MRECFCILLFLYSCMALFDMAKSGNAVTMAVNSFSDIVYVCFRSSIEDCRE
jgi:hypothetical protein